MHVQTCDVISANDVYFSRALVPATVDDVLPSVDVDRSKVEHLDPGQQGELTDEFAACFSEEPVCAEFVEYGYCLYSWCVVWWYSV